MKTKDWLRKTISDFQPYTVATIREKHVINANENYINVLDIPQIREELEEALHAFQPQVYPAPMADHLKEELAAYMGVTADMILCGNGGDELITYILNAFLNPGDTLLLHQPTFDMYELGAVTLGAKLIKVPDLPGFKRDIDGMVEAAHSSQPKLTFICNPNNPTGELISLDDVRRVAEATDYPVIVDEAYMEFAEADSAVSLVKDHPNVIVLRTLSKAFGFAGMRCGYIIAQPEVIRCVAKIKNPYNLNSFTQLFASIVVKHRELVLKTRDQIIIERNRLYEALADIAGVTVYPSRTNFLLIQTEKDGDALFEAWKKEEILVKRFMGKPLLKNAFRITVTTKEVDDLVLKVLKEDSHA